MIAANADIVNSELSDDVKVGDMANLINCTLGKMCMVGRFSKMAYSQMADLSYIGEYSIVINSSIGKFCSISWGCTIGPEDHDYKRVTSHSFLYSTKAFTLVDRKRYSPFERVCAIGNDVWIGCNATVLRGVTIGDGAVIGANSLVNKDVPPYAIVAGSPAKIVKYRFDPEVIERMLRLKWWDLPAELIGRHADLFSQEPTTSVMDQIEALIKTHGK